MDTDKIKGVSGAIISSMAKWERKKADLYPTPNDCTYSLLPYLSELVPTGSLILEPACAEGQMVNSLVEFGYEVHGYDLREDVSGGEGGVDFLSEFFSKSYDAVVTNPPFSLAEEFIRKAIDTAPVVAMLLKSQFWNTVNRKQLFRDTKPFRVLNLTWRPAFLELERGKSPLMDCAWTIWQRGYTGDCRMTMIDRLSACPIDAGGL